VSSKPNIVYLMTDQQKATAASFLGNAHVPSPFMDEMAASGTAFENAYAPSCICTPSRTSVFTGVHPLVHQVTCHQNRAPFNLPQLSEILMDHGYYTAAAGHYEHGRNLTRGWHEQVPHQNWGRLGRSVMEWLSAGRRDLSWSAGGMDCTAEEGTSHLLTDRVIRMIDGAQAAERPFFLHVAYNDPHPPYFVPPPYDTLVDPDSLEMPDPGSDAGRPLWQFECMRECGTERATDEDIRRVVAVYYGMIAYADAQMRRVYDALAERGMLENTWFIIASDHGDYTGEKGLFCKSESLYECLLHVPLIIRPPAGEGRLQAKSVGGLVDLVDLFPTILGIAGAPVPGYAQGHDLVSWVVQGCRQPLRDCLFAQVGDYHGFLKTTWPAGIALSGRHPGLLQGARTERFSYVRDPDYGDEAYDLQSDPRELNNLLGRAGAGDGRNSGPGAKPPEVTELRRRVDDWEAECLRLRKELGVVPGDRGFAEGWE
jgi:arylsulfatase A-like enzyme